MVEVGKAIVLQETDQQVLKLHTCYHFNYLYYICFVLQWFYVTTMIRKS